MLQLKRLQLVAFLLVATLAISWIGTIAGEVQSKELVESASEIALKEELEFDDGEDDFESIEELARSDDLEPIKQPDHGYVNPASAYHSPAYGEQGGQHYPVVTNYSSQGYATSPSYQSGYSGAEQTYPPQNVPLPTPVVANYPTQSYAPVAIPQPYQSPPQASGYSGVQQPYQPPSPPQSYSAPPVANYSTQSYAPVPMPQPYQSPPQSSYSGSQQPYQPQSAPQPYQSPPQASGYSDVQQPYQPPSPPQSYSAPPVANYSTQSYAPVPMPQPYQSPPQSSYSGSQQPYQPPSAPQSYSAPPAANYSTQSYAPVPLPQSYQSPPQPSSYSSPQQTYQPQSYSAPPVANYSTQSYAPVPLPQSYQSPPQPSSYSSPQQTYQPQSYSAPPVANYSTQSYAPVSQPYQNVPQANSYSGGQQNYQSYQTAPQSYHATPQPYQNASQSYQPSSATYGQTSTNYIAPNPQPYKPATPVSYQQPAYPQVANYTAQPQKYATQQTYQQPAKPVNYPQVGPPKQYPVTPAMGYRQALAPNYMMGGLNSMINPKGYSSNHMNYFYYRMSPYMACPKNVYLRPPSPKEIQEAFQMAQQQLLQIRGNTVSYINSTHHSFTARHALFSFLSQINPRMDEEGLLTETVSLYLASKACMTKWDKQRYLPQLTRIISTANYPPSHSCTSTYQRLGKSHMKQCAQSKYRTIDGFCNNLIHPYWGKANICHIRLLQPDYADGISAPRSSYDMHYPLPNPRAISNIIHRNVPLEGLYNLMKMQWGQFINHDITNTALSSYDGLVDCCKNPSARGCWPIYVPPGDPHYGRLNVTCLNFIRSGVCPLCQLGPRQQSNKNSAFLDCSQLYGNSQEQSMKLRVHRGGLLITIPGKDGELLPLASGTSSDQCHEKFCFEAGDNRVNQHPALTALHTLLLRRHNQHARALARRHPDWNDEHLYHEARRLLIAEYQMITFGEYMPIVFGPILSAYYKLIPNKSGYTYYDPNVDPTTWNEYATASCRFGHSQISSTFGLYKQLLGFRQQGMNQPTYRLKEWYMRPSFLTDGLTGQLTTGLLSRSADVVDPWITTDVRDHLYQSHKDLSGGDLAATNIWRGRDHGIAAYIHYLEYCFNYKVYNWNDLKLFIPPQVLGELQKVYKVVQNIDLFTGGLAERHFPGADIGPTFACINGIQYYHIKYGDRYYFEHGGQAGSFSPVQLDEIRRTTLARFLCRTAYIPQVPYYAFMQASNMNPAVNCSQLGEIDYNKF